MPSALPSFRAVIFTRATGSALIFSSAADVGRSGDAGCSGSGSRGTELTAVMGAFLLRVRRKLVACFRLGLQVVRVWFQVLRAGLLGRGRAGPLLILRTVGDHVSVVHPCSFSMGYMQLNGASVSYC